MSTPRAPDLVLKVMNKSTNQKSGRIGCAWVNADGSITVVIDYPHVIQNDPSGNLLYTLFPVRRAEITAPL